jgi:putative ABC transport system permease protein
MSSLSRELHYLTRKLARSPMFTVISIVTLALGIGATSAIFSVVHGVLLKPLPFDEPEELVGVWHRAPGLGFELLNQSPALHFTYRDEGRVFDDIGMWANRQATITGVGEPERVPTMQVTDGTLSLLRVKPVLGRLFTAEDDAPGSPETTVLGYGYWQRRFGGDAGVVGRTVDVDGQPHEIIGVLPADFRFLRWDPAVFLPFQFDRSKLFIGNFSFQGIARLKRGVSIEEANADLARMLPIATSKFPFPSGLTANMLKEARFGPNVRPLKDDVVGDVGATLWILLGTVGVVLLIACANVANLFLVRAEGRQRELALRSALGADRARVAKELLGESVGLGLLGGLAGLGVAYGAIRILVAMAPETLPRLNEITLDGTVLAFTLATSLVAGVLFGLLPVFKFTRPNMAGALKEGGRTASDGRERQRARGALVVAQIALALVLLIGSGLMIRSFQALRHVAPGFVAPSDVLTFRVSIPESQIRDNDEVPRAHEQILRKIEAIPGVTSAGLSSSVTMDGNDSGDPIFVEEFPMEADQLPPIRRFKWISPGYFETMGNPIVAGRSITWDDVRQKAPVVVVTENFAREFWKRPADALGKRVRVNPKDKWREIVGVVGDVHDDGVDQKVTVVMYWPMSVTDFWGEAEFARRNMAYVLRGPRVGEAGFLEQVRQAVWSLNPDVPVANVQMLDEILAKSMSRTSFTLVMLVIASAVALLIGAVGLYGVISYGVTQRTREIGVRVALGARTADVSWMFLRHAALLAGIGIVVGLGAAFGLTRAMSSLLFNVSPVDPLTYALVSLVLVGIALVASYVPARRAARIDPTEALHWE